MNLTDWVVGNLKPYKLALNSPTRIGSFLPTIYGCVLPTLTKLSIKITNRHILWRLVVIAR